MTSLTRLIAYVSGFTTRPERVMTRLHDEYLIIEAHLQEETESLPPEDHRALWQVLEDPDQTLLTAVVQ